MSSGAVGAGPSSPPPVLLPPAPSPAADGLPRPPPRASYVEAKANKVSRDGPPPGRLRLPFPGNIASLAARSSCHSRQIEVFLRSTMPSTERDAPSAARPACAQEPATADGSPRGQAGLPWYRRGTEAQGGSAHPAPRHPAGEGQPCSWNPGRRPRSPHTRHPAARELEKGSYSDKTRRSQQSPGSGWVCPEPSPARAQKGTVGSLLRGRPQPAGRRAWDWRGHGRMHRSLRAPGHPARPALCLRKRRLSDGLRPSPSDCRRTCRR